VNVTDSKTNNRKMVAIVIVLVFVVGAGIVFLTIIRGSGPVEVISESSIEQQTDVAPVETEVAIVPEDTVVSEDTQAEETPEEVVVPAPKAGLEATDPSVVNLASGEIQLVEFFAFW
jgi:hypothetical protein